MYYIWDEVKIIFVTAKAMVNVNEFVLSVLRKTIVPSVSEPEST